VEVDPAVLLIAVLGEKSSPKVGTMILNVFAEKN
jgi:hypothetical protein